ncbi:MAG: hypothetical protein JXA77_00125 [Bacteroidales bacterium]|nr:hypothetical protein [Bacteroidales bacterium]MBN2821254.1 hypothetical protein [Bacteroidales bacterium]
MKTFSSILSLLIIVFSLNAQDCEVFLPGKVGTVLEHTHYNKKDKITGKATQTLQDIQTSDGVTSYLMKQVLTDEKGENPMENEYQFKCKDGVFILDMEMYFSQETMQAYEGMDIKVTADEIDLPSTNAQPGQKLKDGTVTMQISAGPMPMTMKVHVVDRKVLAVEKLTTPAGTFDCVKITETVNGEFGFIKTSTSAITWYSLGVGTIRSETYDKSGKLDSYMELTSIKE